MNPIKLNIQRFAINVSQAFKRTSAAPIDETLALTKAEMPLINDNVMPAYYLTICQDDGMVYLYDKSATADPTLGKFSPLKAGSSIFSTTEDLSGDILGTEDFDISDITDLSESDVILGKTFVYDDNGRLGLISAIDTTVTPTTITITTIVVSSTGAGDSPAKYNYTTNIEVGGIPTGTSITSTDLLADIIKDMLVTTYYPTYTAPSASLSYTADANVEVKSTISARTGTVGYNAGAITLQGVKQNDRGGAATKYYLSTSGADTEYSADSTSSGTFSVSALTRSTKGSITLTAKVDYAQGPQPKDSNGDDYGSPLAAGSVTATKKINFIQSYFYGKTANATISDFTGLTKSVTTKGQKQFSFTTNNERMVMAYDSSYGNLSSILDPNSFEVISGWTKSTLTVDGFTYFVYIADAPTTDTNAKFTFKY